MFRTTLTWWFLPVDVRSFSPARLTVFSRASLNNVNGQMALVSRRTGLMNCLKRTIGEDIVGLVGVENGGSAPPLRVPTICCANLRFCLSCLGGKDLQGVCRARHPYRRSGCNGDGVALCGEALTDGYLARVRAHLIDRRNLRRLNGMKSPPQRKPPRYLGAGGHAKDRRSRSFARRAQTA